MLDLEGARAFIQNGMMTALTLVLLLGIAAWQMIATDPLMAVIGLAFTPIAGVVLARMGFMLRVTWLQVQRLMSILTLTMEENLQGIRVVRAFAAKRLRDGQVRRGRRRRAGLFLPAHRAAFPRRVGDDGELLRLHGRAAVGRRTQGGGRDDDAGRLTEFLTYMTLLQSPIRQIAMIFAAAARATTSGGRLFEILDLEPDVADAPGAPPI